MPYRQPATVNVAMNGRGRWEIATERSGLRAVCDGLEDARRVARQYAESHQPCRIIVRDAYQRVSAFEVIPEPAPERRG